MIAQLKQIFQESGFKGVWDKGTSVLYKRGIRPFLPSEERFLYAGIPVALERKWGDRHVPENWKPDGLENKPHYEAALIGGLRRHVRPGDRVVIVGGGIGATAALAALLVGEEGRVFCYEAGGRGVRDVRRTARLNGVADRLTVTHAAVGPVISVYGPRWGHRSVLPADLPACDVLELDCEGAEVDILRSMVIRPRVVLVETHGVFGAPTERVASLLAERGYDVENAGIAEPELARVCEEQDIHVLIGTRTDGADALVG